MALRNSFPSPASDLSRRRLLLNALASGAALTPASRLFAATEFWNARDASTWTDDEIRTLVSKSPWARSAVPSFKGADDPTGASAGQTGGRGAGMGRRPGGDAVLVRWESAQPILDAMKAPLAADLAGHYVLSVTNLPIPNAPRPGRAGEKGPDDVLDRMQNGAILQAKGKEPAEAGIARRNHIGSFLFGFSRDYLRLAPTDREIAFKLDTGPLTLTVRFDGKEMMYRGRLAV
jgi:hypothetical protein